MQCHYFDAGRCRSCTHMGVPYATQLDAKDAHCRALLAGHPGIDWLPPLAGGESGFRNKAKMVVAGTSRRPTIGILDADGRGIDLRRCGICSPGLREAFRVLSNLVRAARLEPYDVPSRTGELKAVLVTEAPDGGLMVRFVLRSDALVPALREHLPGLRERLPRLEVASVNLQPEHKAVLEGPVEIPLTERESLLMRINGIGLHLRPQSFFQTNTEVAAALYRQGREWVDEVAPRTVWDLYCGVGGFALHLAAPGRDVLGIELSGEAIASAEATAAELGFDAGARGSRPGDAGARGGLSFAAGDATEFALAADRAPELVVVNPPRRGIGAALAGWLEHSEAAHVLYSSCNARTLARDLEAMPSLRPVRARVMDMFPQSDHYEAMVLLERVPAA
ncbi:23S rRNA (uracil(747)-C(5))-methyltransferase RlmC [Zafaria sp. Z1313]|uniref:23S rRNA (uracil(747)-C(5))-methyltransferase RlmC n=1 Tax=Zafaria sp. Z1313 TaxID=3423202 RepID=UPI003D303C95